MEQVITVDERARSMLADAYKSIGHKESAAHIQSKKKTPSWPEIAALAALTTAINQLDEAEELQRITEEVGERWRQRALAADEARAVALEAGEAGQATLAAMDKYNEANGTFIIGPSLLRLAKSVAKITAALNIKPAAPSGEES